MLALLSALALVGACDAKDDGPSDEQGDLEEADFAEDEDDVDEDEEEPEEDTDAPEPGFPEHFEPCDWDTMDEGIACEMDDGQVGRQECIVIDGEAIITPCSTEEPACNAGDNWDDGCSGVMCLWNGVEFIEERLDDSGCGDTPLVLNFDGGPVEYGPVAAATFDLSTDGSCTNTSWPTSPWLALDRDGDGMIRSGAELFGSATAMASGRHASNGFMALAELDSNLDGRISAEDERFAELVLWNDWDEDRVGAYAELQPLSQTSLVSIELSYDLRAACDGQGNCGIERASFEYRKGDATAFGEVVDVHLLCQ